MPAKSPHHAALGAALRAARVDRDLTLEALSDRIAGGMNSRYISACERGEVNVSYGNLLRICDGLGSPASSVVRSAEDRLQGSD